MCTRMGFYSPKDGTSIEEAFLAHVDIHSPIIMGIVQEVATPGLKKYVVGGLSERSVEVPPFTGYVHMIWDDENAMNRYLDTLDSRRPLAGDTFITRVKWHSTAFLEERVVLKKEPAGDTRATSWSFYRPRDGITIQEAFDTDASVHSKNMLKAMGELAIPGLVEYIVGKVASIAEGEPSEDKLWFTNYHKMIWEDADAMNRYLGACRTNQFPDGTSWKKDDVIWDYAASFDERVVFPR